MIQMAINRQDFKITVEALELSYIEDGSVKWYIHVSARVHSETTQ